MPEVDAQIANYTWWLAILTGALVFATVLLGAVTIYGIRRQSNETRIANRAYLSVAPLGIEPFGMESVAHITVQNVGHLPAKNVSWFIDYAITPNGKLRAPPIDDGKFYGKNFVIHPGAEMKRSKDCILTEAEAQSLRQSTDRARVFFYVWGEVRYQDGFGTVRSTKFNHRYDHRGIEKVPQGRWYAGQDRITPESMRYHQFGNDAD